MECYFCEGACKCMLHQKGLKEIQNMTCNCLRCTREIVNKNHNFSIAGSAECAPNSEEYDKEMNEATMNVDKEWIKRLLEEFSKPLIVTDEMYENGGLNQYIDEFLDNSDVFNGK